MTFTELVTELKSKAEEVLAGNPDFREKAFARRIVAAAENFLETPGTEEVTDDS